MPADSAYLTRLYNSCSDLGDVDPTFTVVEKQEILTHIDAAAKSSDGGFRMQTIGLRDRDEPIGYLHLSHWQPRAETTWISIFVLGAEYHGQGYGREVAAGLVDELKRLSWCEEIWLKVYVGNEVALRHWVGIGFRQIVEVRPTGSEGNSRQPSLVLSYRCRQ